MSDYFLSIIAEKTGMFRFAQHDSANMKCVPQFNDSQT
jgi:hypothetical protein